MAITALKHHHSVVLIPAAAEGMERLIMTRQKLIPVFVDQIRQIAIDEFGEGGHQISSQRRGKPAQAAATLKFFSWAYQNGDKTADELDYVPMPASVKTLIERSWAEIKDTSGKPIAFK